MRSHVSFFPLIAAGVLTATLIAATFSSTNFVTADEKKAPDQAGPSQPGGNRPASDGKAAPKPKFAGLKVPLDVNDEVAALESLQFALTELGDGSTYVWHRNHGRLSGLVRPTVSFKDARGNVCRHVIVVLNGTEGSGRTEAIACRLATGVWQLDG